MPDGDRIHVDYFAILDLPRDASQEQIAAAIKQQLRIWQRRTTSPDLSKRQQAEQRVQLLGQAREVLLDEVRRASYLDQLAAASEAAASESAAAGSAPTGGSARRAEPHRRPPGEPAGPPPGPQDPTGRPRREGPPQRIDWLRQAVDSLAAGDPSSAAYAAREARQENDRSAQAWSVLSRANAALGNLRDAVVEARRAAQLDPGWADYHMELGAVHEQLEEWSDALECYRRARELVPDAERPRVAMADALLRIGRPQEARPILTELLGAGDDPEQVAGMLATCLVMEAEQTPVVQREGGYVVTSKREIAAMRPLLERVGEVTDDPRMLADVHRVQRYLRWCERRHFRPGGTAVTGCLILLFVVVGIPALALGILSFVTGPSLTSFFVVAATVAFIVTCFLAWFPPGWKINRRGRKPGTAPGGPEQGAGPAGPQHGTGPAGPQHGTGPAGPQHGTGPAGPR